MRKSFTTVVSIFGFLMFAKAQTLGGTSVFNFLRFSSSPQTTALGGINVSQFTQDVSLSANNPALLSSAMNGQLSANFSSLRDGFNNYHLVGAVYRPKIATSFYGAVNFFDYGTIRETDAAGNVLGQIRPSDYVVQLGASRMYGERISYGASLKFAHSSYGPYRASGLAFDAGISYTDTARSFRVGLVLKNMGIQTSSFAGSGRESLPFDIQIGISKKLEKAPLQFTLTLHHLHQFNIRYSDSSFNIDNGLDQLEKGKLVDKVFRHLVFSAQFFVSDKLEISTGYNYLRRKELNIGTTGNGLNGFSMGLGILVKKIQIRYSKTFYLGNFATNQFGLGISLKSFADTHKQKEEK